MASILSRPQCVKQTMFERGLEVGNVLISVLLFYLLTALTHSIYCIYASVKYTNIASDNCLLPIWRQAII